LLAFLLIAWKWELIGGILLVVIGILMSPVVFQHNYKMNHSMWMSLTTIILITIPFVIVGILFLGSSRLKRKNKQTPVQNKRKAKPNGLKYAISKF
jgi:hypothetical protein